jgi:hypothetical protein
MSGEEHDSFQPGEGGLEPSLSQMWAMYLYVSPKLYLLLAYLTGVKISTYAFEKDVNIQTIVPGIFLPPA